MPLFCWLKRLWFDLQVESRRRFRINRTWDQDGWASSSSFCVNLLHAQKSAIWYTWLLLCLTSSLLCRYRVAEVEWVHDFLPEQSEERAQVCNLLCNYAYPSYKFYIYGLLFGWLQLHELATNASEYAVSWLGRAKEAARSGKAVKEYCIFRCLE